MKQKLMFLCVFTFLQISCYKVAVVGTGYVGLVMGAALADFGHTVQCVDIVQEKINQLNKGIIPIYEPGLEELVVKNTASQKLSFSTNIQHALEQAEIIILAVGTPMRQDGTADASAIFAALETVADVLQDHVYRIVCIKSTVPIGTADLIKNMLAERCTTGSFDVVSNPEFLREGCAVKDFMEPERVIVGATSPKAVAILQELYQPLQQKHIPFFVTDSATAETIKYASNAFLAIKIAYINEIAELCQKTGANIFDVAHGMGLDSRIGNKFLTPGPGYGGSCFPKDTNALLKKAEALAMDLRTVRAAIEANDAHKKNLVNKVAALVPGGLTGKAVAVLGLAFKANTDDVRESAAIDVINGLLEHGATVYAYDPLAMPNMKKIVPNIHYAASAQEALQHADAAIVLTEWEEFKNLKASNKKLCKLNIPVLDTRNILRES